MSCYLRYPWQEPYLLAMAELDPKIFTSKAFTARTAIADRIKIVGTLDDAEREAVDDALTGLSMMKGPTAI